MIEIVDISGRLPGNLASRNRRARKLEGIRLIVVHIDGVDVPPADSDGPGYEPVERYAAQAREHLARNWNSTGTPAIRGFGLMHHYRVSADGRVWRTQPEELITWHARLANQNGLAICCDLGPGQLPTLAQLKGLKSLLDWLCLDRPDIPATRADVWAHGELPWETAHKSCPGNLLEWVQVYRKGLFE